MGNVVSYTVSGLNLTDEVTYYAMVRAVGLAGNTSASAVGDGWTVNVLPCPTNYVKVPGNANLGTSVFCVMKYEAKITGDDSGTTAYNANFVAEARVTGKPWVNITRNNARIECQALGTGYDLLSNSQWQALARNIESVGANWSAGSLTGNVDDGIYINRGNSDNSPGWGGQRQVMVIRA